MRIKSLLIVVAAGLVLASCARTSVTPLSQSQFLISTSAAPACGRSGASKVASRMAAVETIRRGYPRYIILAGQSQNNVSVINRSPSHSYTSGTATVSGNAIYGNSTTTYVGGGPTFYGSNDADLRVLMLKRGDQGYAEGLDAKEVLGSKWAELVERGINTCTD